MMSNHSGAITDTSRSDV